MELLHVEHGKWLKVDVLWNVSEIAKLNILWFEHFVGREKRCALSEELMQLVFKWTCILIDALIMNIWERGLFHKNKKLFERHLNTCNSSVPIDSSWNHMAIRIYLWLAINWMIFTNSLPIGNGWKSPKIHPSIISIHFKLFTIPETNIAPQNGRLEDQFPFGARPIFMGSQ